MSDSMTYNQRMLLILRNRGFDDSQIAEMIGASRTTVNQVINGKRSGRNIEPRIRKLAEAMSLTDEVEANNTIIRIPATSTKAAPSPTTLTGTIKETIRAIPRMAQAKLITDRNEIKEAKEQRQQALDAARDVYESYGIPAPTNKPQRRAPKYRVTERDVRTGKAKHSKTRKRADKLVSHYLSTNQMVRQLMGVDTPETPDAEEQESLIKLKTLPDGRLSVGIKQDAQWCIYCQRRPGTMLLPYGGFTCPECNRNHISDPRVYR